MPGSIQALLVHQIPIRPIPTVTDQNRVDGIELHPGEVMQRFPIFITSRAGNTGGVDITRAPAIAMKRDPFAATPFQLMVHVTEHHQVSPSLLLHAIKRKGQITIPPVDMRLLPIPTAGTVRIRSQPCGSAMGQHNERPIGWRLRCGRHDAIGRFLFGDRTEHGLNRLREMKPTASAAGACTNNGHLRLLPLAQTPGTVPVAQHRELLLQQTAASVSTAVMVSQKHGNGTLQLHDPFHQAKIAIAQITNEQQGVGLQPMHQLCISITPVPMEITGDCKTDSSQGDF